MKPFIAYDVQSTPDITTNQGKLGILDILRIKDDTGYLFYDSRKGKYPIVMDGKLDCKIVDYNVPKWKTKLKLIVRKVSKKILIKKLSHGKISKENK